MSGFLVARITQHHAVIIEGVQVTFLSSVPGHQPDPEKRDANSQRRRQQRRAHRGSAGAARLAVTLARRASEVLWKPLSPNQSNSLFVGQVPSGFPLWGLILASAS